MPNRDIFSLWLSSAELDPLWHGNAREQARMLIAGVASELEHPSSRGYPYGGFDRLCAELPPPLREQAEALFLRVWEASGTGKQHAMLDLLCLIGFTADPASIPFWKQAAALARVRDATAAQRRGLVAAALAYTALRHPGSGALQALEELGRDEHVDARIGAVDALVHLATTDEGPLVDAARRLIRRVAQDEGAFAPRFLARRFLLRAGEPLPPYEQGNVIAFDVAFGKARRTLELGADHTLGDLHHAILGAFGWDHDHLHQFTLHGDLRDQRFTIPALDEVVSPFDLPGEPDDAPSEEESLPLGALALPTGYQFVYLYDFGDHNVFRIKVAGTHPAAPRTKYPRVAAKVGKNPPQYAGM